MQLSEQCCRIAPKQEGTDRQKDDFSYRLSDAFLGRLLWRLGVAHKIIMRIAANIAKLPDLLQAASKRRRRAYSSERATADLLLRLLVTASG